jgi:hypothetical protein
MLIIILQSFLPFFASDLRLFFVYFLLLLTMALRLAVATGCSIQTWDYQSPSNTIFFEPFGNNFITSLAWNHNGHGEINGNSTWAQHKMIT